MHERYSYVSDLLLVLLALLSGKYLPYALAAVCISGVTYTNYLQNYALWNIIRYLAPIAGIAWVFFTLRILPTALIAEKQISGNLEHI